MLAVEIIFWAAVGGLVHTHLTYPVSLAILARTQRRDPAFEPGEQELRPVSLIIAAHDEAPVIARRVENAFALDYPSELLEVIVASDGSSDDTVGRAQNAGASVVLDLPRNGKVEAQNAGVAVSSGEVLAFSDANTLWEPDALRRLVEALADPRVAYVCGQVSLTGGGFNQEGAYWRYEMAVRELESRLAGITAGNGAIYAVPRDAYVVMSSDRGHDLCLPYLAIRSGRRAIYEPRARAKEPMAPTIGGEWARKRRMMNRTWGIILADRILYPRGYGFLYAYEMLSHRALRYLSPFLHVVALGSNLLLLGEGTLYVAALLAQAALLAAAVLGSFVPFRPFRVATYYVSVTASIAVGLYDRLRSRPAATWEPVEETR